jgi:hypothetical protein
MEVFGRILQGNEGFGGEAVVVCINGHDVFVSCYRPIRSDGFVLWPTRDGIPAILAVMQRIFVS